ncbi:hypothetical protein [Pseudomonas sp. LRF_L74]|uniref:hypothetical protein n=1 Tax=Pseudomonas sp. LRF_L74 TaxID=3369422 RepID=UPI003F5D7FB4
MSIEAGRLLAYVLVTLLGLATGWQVHAWKAGSDEAIRLQAKQDSEEVARGMVADIAKQTVAAISGIRITNKTIYQRTQHEIIKEPMDPGCRIPASWMRNINDARANRSGVAAALP